MPVILVKTAGGNQQLFACKFSLAEFFCPLIIPFNRCQPAFKSPADCYGVQIGSSGNYAAAETDYGTRQY
ncbi:hypothetical protein Barb7_02125 [Bacteroidales bacterium Barb7]|nr:hypothetical protein Barb7_02125 [Bacteroidales bacterium Barb7]